MRRLLTYHSADADTGHKIEHALEILYEDSDLLVINKPVGISVSFSEGGEDTVETIVSKSCCRQDNTPVYCCISHLDRNTSGLTMVAKHTAVANLLTQMTLERKIHREYLAIVNDHALPDLGIVNAPIGKKEDSALEHRIDFINGDRAVTQYQVLSRENGYAFVSLFLDTERTHQIRLHMRYLKSPLVGDGLYNSAEAAYLHHLELHEPDQRILKRQALHSAKLEFIHPVTGQSLSFTQKLSEDLLTFMAHNMSFTFEEYE